VRPGWASAMNKIDSIGRHIFYKKRNEKPYVVEASTSAPESDPVTVSVASITPNVTPASASPALGLGMAPSE